jgi:hypothetical protein
LTVSIRNGNVAVGGHIATSGTGNANIGAVLFTSLNGI